MMTAENKIFIKVDEAALRVGLGRSKFYSLVQAGEIPAVKIGRSTRIAVRQLEEWADRQVAEAGRHAAAR